MKKHNYLIVVLILTGLAFIFNLPANGGITGKIKGVVKDSQTGDPLPGVNVMITKVWVNNQESVYSGGLGAATNIHGAFIILKVPPGIYSVTAQMMGYTTATHQRAKISVDRTTVLNFSLSQTVLELGESVTIEATRDMIQLDVSATENYITAAEYQTTPFANRLGDVIGLQSGVTGNIAEGDIKIREGNAREVGFLLDGIDMVDQKFQRPITTIQPGMVQEIKIMRNGFNAEYGQARSGVINVITKNPSPQIHFNIDYQLKPAQMPHYGRNKYDSDYNLWRLYAGANAFEGDTLRTPDGRYENVRHWEGWNSYSERLLNDNNPDNDLTADEAYELWKWRHRPIDYGNLQGHNLDLSLSGGIPFMPWQTNFLLGGKYEFHPFNYQQSRDHYDERSSMLKLVNILSPNIKLTLNGLYSEVRTVPGSNPTSQWSRENHISYGGGGFPNYYPYSRPLLNRFTSVAGAKFTHTISPRKFYEINLNYFYSKYWMGMPPKASEEDGRYFHDRLYYDPQSGKIFKEDGVSDAVSGYQMYGGGLTWEDSYDRRTTLNFSMVNQFHPAHELKFGLESNFEVLKEHRVHWNHEDSTQLYQRDYKVNPIELGTYIQDKIEFQGMIANVGVRFDYFYINSSRPDPNVALNYASDREIYQTFLDGEYPTTRPEAKFYVSPRIGVSHPLSHNSKIYFNYGHFIQTPRTHHLYVANVDGARPSMLQMGDSNLQFEKNIAYELGCDISVRDFAQVHIGAFYKEYFDLANVMTFAHSDQSLIMDYYATLGYADTRGIEIEIRKPTGRFITGWLNYTFIEKNESDLSIPGLSENPIVLDDPNIGIDGMLWGVPMAKTPILEPYGRGVITFMAPSGWGPKIKGYSIFGKTNLSFQVFYQGGTHRRHPRGTFRDQHPNVWFKELDRYWTNMRLSRQFNFKSLSWEFYMDASNILHSKYRYPPGGRSGDDYYDDLWESGKLDQVGTDKLTDPEILNTENDDVWWAKVKTFIFGLRIFM